MAKYTIVISEDALLYDDWAVLKELPAFGSVWKDAALIKRTRSVYPTLTYPCHTTMRTGLYPNRHGVVNNEQTILGEVSSLWNHFNDIVTVPDIFDYAKAAGMTTAAVFWPVTGNHKNIDYLVDEYWPQTPEDDPAECYADAGSSPEVMEIVRANIHLVRGHQRRHPWNDEFIFGCACDIIRKFKPNLLMMHPGNVDGYRHEAGVNSIKATHGLHECDLWLSDIFQALDEAGIRNETNIFVVSDHGQMDVRGSVHPSVLLRRAGLVDVDENGKVRDYVALAKSVGGSCYIYLKNPDDKEAWQKTYDVLQAACEEGVYGIERVFTVEEANELEHLSGPFSFVLESNGVYSFGNEWMEPVVRCYDDEDYKLAHATHGYLPDKGPQPTFLAFGPDIRHITLEHAGIVDIAPTVAHSFGVEMKDVDGHVVKEIFK